MENRLSWAALFAFAVTFWIVVSDAQAERIPAPVVTGNFSYTCENGRKVVSSRERGIVLNLRTARHSYTVMTRRVEGDRVFIPTGKAPEAENWNDAIVLGTFPENWEICSGTAGAWISLPVTVNSGLVFDEREKHKGSCFYPFVALMDGRPVNWESRAPLELRVSEGARSFRTGGQRVYEYRSLFDCVFDRQPIRRDGLR